MKLTNRRMKKDHSAALKTAKKCASDSAEEELAALRALVRKCEEERESLSSQLDSATTASLDLTQVTDDDLIEKNKELRQKNKLLNKEISSSRQNLIDNQENTMKVMRQYEKLRKDKEQTDEQLRQEKSKNVGLEQSITAMKTSSSISLSQSKKEAKSSEEQLRKRIHVRALISYSCVCSFCLFMSSLCCSSSLPLIHLLDNKTFYLSYSSYERRRPSRRTNIESHF